MPSTKENKPTSSFILISLVLILVVSTVLRLYRLGEGLWLDEITTYINYATKPFITNITTFESENQHFLYSLMAHASFLVFGENAWALRLPAVIFGIASLLALFFFGLEITDSQEAILATGLMAFSYHHVWFSQNARGYTGLLFWSLISSWLLLRGMRQQKVYLWILYAICAALGMYTHLTMGFVVFGQFIVYLLSYLLRRVNRNKGLKSGIFYGFFLAGFFTLLIHIPVLNQMRSIIGGSQISLVSEWKSPIWTIMEILQGLSVGFSTGMVGLLALGMFGLGVWSYWKSCPEFLGLLFIPPIFGAAVTIAIGHHLWPRFFFFALGFGTLVVIRGIMMVGEWISKRLNIADNRLNWVGVILCLGLIIISAVSIRWAYGPKQDFDSAYEFINNNRLDGDVITTVGIASFVFQDFYQVDWVPLINKEQLDKFRSDANRIWIIYTFPEVLEATNPDIMKDIQDDFTLIAEFPGTVRSGTVYIVSNEK